MSKDKADISAYGVPYEDLTASDIDDEDGDMVLEQHVTVNNTAALTRITEEFKWSDIPLFEYITVTSSEPTKIVDVFDDLSREKAFHDQALDAARFVKQQAAEQDAPFLPPADKTFEMARSISTLSKKPHKQAQKSAKNQRAEKEAAETERLMDKATLLRRKRKEGDVDSFLQQAEYDSEVDLSEEEYPTLTKRRRGFQKTVNQKLNRNADEKKGKKLASQFIGKGRKPKSSRLGKSRRKTHK
ncbi:hypothetical protein BCR43DRAFT_560236 [Syncephalastrum racemosum]|uniref:Eukaryotic rRNA processing n=1 Tax=Syncephalastrum racemosum TaxID=13706 RepID=A0A1X2HVR4_SYNRA|nr:hypothetical protein BCR43DRAFT_560236 [Syncephalastrum racemosum]